MNISASCAVYAKEETTFPIIARSAIKKYKLSHVGSHLIMKYCDEHYWQKDIHHCIELNQKPIKKPFVM